MQYYAEEPPIITDFTETLTARTDIVSVSRFYKEAKVALGLTAIAGHDGLDILIREKSLNRPALALTGYFKHFAEKRLQLFGIGEMAYLHDLPAEKQTEVLNKIFDMGVPGILVSSCEHQPPPALNALADARKIPVLSSTLPSKDLFPEATLCLERLFAPKVNLHATLMSVGGLGILLCGASGVGKSECALALIEHGHSLVADDSVIVELRGDRCLHGYVKESGRGAMECRGIGIIDVIALFGARAFLLEKSVDLVIELVDWEEGMDEDRSGTERKRIAMILGKELPHIVLAVRPGRDIARLVEVAALVHTRLQGGFDFNKEFNARLKKEMRKNANQAPPPATVIPANTEPSSSPASTTVAPTAPATAPAAPTAPTAPVTTAAPVTTGIQQVLCSPFTAKLPAPAAPTAAATLPSLLALLLCACALLFTACSNDREKYENAFLAGDYQKAYAIAADAPSDIAAKSEVFWQLHSADAAHLAGQLDDAIANYSRADHSFRALDTDSDALTAAQYAASLLLNDNALPYAAKPFERIMANTREALAFLEKKDLPKARAHLTAARDWQATSVQRFAKEIDKQDRAISENKNANLGNRAAAIDTNKILADTQFNEQHVPDPTFRAYGDYANPLTTYLLGVTALLDHDYARATDSLKNASGMLPTNQQIAAEADYFKDGTPAENRVWVIIENGLAPKIEEVRLALPLLLPNPRTTGFLPPTTLSLAFPKLTLRPSPYGGFCLSVPGKTDLLYSEVLANIDGIFRAEYNKTISYTLTREIFRSIFKAIAQYATTTTTAATTATTADTNTTEVATDTAADTRQWTTLPKDIHLITLNMPPDRRFSLSPINLAGTPAAPAIHINLPPCKNAIVYVRIPTRIPTAPPPRIILLD
jgi:HPr kinase/phosphorylase